MSKQAWAVHDTDALTFLRGLPDGCAHTCVTSPPYWMLRSYLPAGHPRKALELGQEKVPDCFGWATGKPCGACFCCRLVAVFREVRRVLHPSGTLWLNVAGSYASGAQANKNGTGATGLHRDGRRSDEAADRANTVWAAGMQAQGSGKATPPGWRPKDYVNVPALLAEALRVDGWYLRAEVYLRKVAPMPESVRDRPTRASERLYLLAKEGAYFYDQEAEREPPVTTPQRRFTPHGYGKEGPTKQNGSMPLRDVPVADCDTAGRNLWDWWTLPPEEEDDTPDPDWEWRPEPDRSRHFAIMPSFLARRCIRLGSSEHGCCPACRAPWVRVVERETVRRQRPNALCSYRGINGQPDQTKAGVRVQTTGWQPSCACPPAPAVPCLVIDPFAGSGTTGREARRLGRHFQGSELSPEFSALARQRIGGATPLFDLLPEDPD